MFCVFFFDQAEAQRGKREPLCEADLTHPPFPPPAAHSEEVQPRSRFHVPANRVRRFKLAGNSGAPPLLWYLESAPETTRLRRCIVRCGSDNSLWRSGSNSGQRLDAFSGDAEYWKQSFSGLVTVACILEVRRLPAAQTAALSQRPDLLDDAGQASSSLVSTPSVFVRHFISPRRRFSVWGTNKECFKRVSRAKRPKKAYFHLEPKCPPAPLKADHQPLMSNRKLLRQTSTRGCCLSLAPRWHRVQQNKEAKAGGGAEAQKAHNECRPRVLAPEPLC